MRLRNIDYPRLFLIVLAAVVLLASGVGVVTSDTDYEVFNPSWSGASDLVSTIENTGTDVVIVQSTDEYSSMSPDGVSLIMSPTVRYSSGPISKINRYMSRGGTVMVADDFGDISNSLLERLGAETRINRSLVRDDQHYYRSNALPVTSNFVDLDSENQVADIPVFRNNSGFGDDSVFDAVDELKLNFPASLDPGGSKILINTSGYAYRDRNNDGEIDDNETAREYPVMSAEKIGNGTLIVSSDPSIFTNSMLKRTGNKVFAENLFEPYDTVYLDYSHSPLFPYVANLLVTIAKSPYIQVAILLSTLSGILLTFKYLRGELDIYLSSIGGYLPEPILREIVWKPGIESDVGMSEKEMREFLVSRHPDWDDDFVEEVASNIHQRQNKIDNDES